jgi:hypothetical protein
MKYFSSEPGFKKDRRLTAQRLIGEKIKSMTDPGGALNYGERMELIERRSILDYTNAYRRFRAIYQGLSQIFGIPPDPLPARGDPAKSRPIEESVEWLRKAADNLAQFLLSDQTYTRHFSLASHLNSDKLKEVVQRPVQFEIAETDFPGQYHVRLQAISAVVYHDGDFGPDNPRLYQMRLSPPKNSKIRFNGSAASNNLLQDHLPPIWLGRVAGPLWRRDPDVVGQALKDSSPIGAWVLELDDRSKQFAAYYSLSDIVLDLQISVQV